MLGVPSCCNQCLLSMTTDDDYPVATQADDWQRQHTGWLKASLCVAVVSNLLPYSPHLKNVTALTCKMHKFFIFFIFSRVSNTKLRKSCGCVLLRHGLNFSRAWWSMQLISGAKDWKHASMQKVVTLNICCDVACLTLHLPHITTGSFQSHQRLEECNIPSVRWKSYAFYKVVWWYFSGVVGNSETT